MSDWISEIAAEIPVESLPEEFQMVVDISGMEIALRLAKHFGGMTIYLPKLEKLVRNVRNTWIMAEFTGNNHRALARKYDLTETSIRKIVRVRSD